MYEDRQSIEDLNYDRDPRVTAEYIPEPPKGIPFHWEVCGLCRGEGKVVNPSIDAGGIPGSDFAEDPDFAEAYFGGDFDIQCPQCRGRRVIPEIDGTGPFYDEDGEPICINPDGHEWGYSGTEYGGDDDRWCGEGRCLCIHCGADGDG